VLLSVKSNQKTLYRQIGCQFEGKRKIPFIAMDHEKRHGRDTAWELITDTLTRKGKRSVRRHLFLTSVRTTPEAMLRLIRQRWSIENEWHWARDAQLGEDAHRYANRIGAPVFAFLRTIVMNLLRRAGYRSIRQGLRELAYDIRGMLALGGVQPAENRI
jgi:predicted transposase YbfD/YdcC